MSSQLPARVVTWTIRFCLTRWSYHPRQCQSRAAPVEHAGQVADGDVVVHADDIEEVAFVDGSRRLVTGDDPVTRVVGWQQGGGDHARRGASPRFVGAEEPHGVLLGLVAERSAKSEQGPEAVPHKRAGGVGVGGHNGPGTTRSGLQLPVGRRVQHQTPVQHGALDGLRVPGRGGGKAAGVGAARDARRGPRRVAEGAGH